MSDGRRKRRRPVRPSAVIWLSWWAVSFALWMGLVFKTELAEVLAGGLAAALAATAVEIVRIQGHASFAPRARWLVGVVRLPSAVLKDTGILTAALWRRVAKGEPISGSMRTVHFASCAGDDPRSASRRVLAKWLGGVAPNTYVIGFDENRDTVLVHQLVPTADPPDVDPEPSP